jgi:hypothetical protein
MDLSLRFIEVTYLSHFLDCILMVESIHKWDVSDPATLSSWNQIRRLSLYLHKDSNIVNES